MEKSLTIEKNDSFYKNFFPRPSTQEPSWVKNQSTLFSFNSQVDAEISAYTLLLEQDILYNLQERICYILNKVRNFIHRITR